MKAVVHDLIVLLLILIMLCTSKHVVLYCLVKQTQVSMHTNYYITRYLIVNNSCNSYKIEQQQCYYSVSKTKNNNHIWKPAI